MSTMGIAVYNSNANNTPSSGVPGEQLMLLRTLQDNERNIIGNSNRASPAAAVLAVKNNVSVININTNLNAANNQQQMQNENEQNVTAIVTATTTTTASKRGNQPSNNVLPPYDPTRLKKHGKNGQPPPIAVAKRNARERNRVKQVNNGFATLRQHIPSHVAQGYGDRGKKLSKVETLRMAVEYIRGLQRLLSEADGIDYDVTTNNRNNLTLTSNDSSMMIPSPTNSVYSGSTHNGSGEVLGLGGSELDEHQSAIGENVILDDDLDSTENYLVPDDMDEADEGSDRRDNKRFKPDDRLQNRLSENQNRNTTQRCRRNSPTLYFNTNQQTFGDEENIEPNRNNNNNINATNNNVLLTYSPTLLQNTSPTALPPIKREIRLIDEDDTCRASPITEEPAQNILIASSSPYSGEIYIENQEGRLIPLKIEDPDAQLIYVSSDAMPAVGNDDATTYTYKSEITAAEAGNTTEFMDVVSCWWDQDRLVQQLQQNHHHHHHHVVQHPHQQTHHHHHQQHHQQISVPVQQRLAHV